MFAETTQTLRHLEQPDAELIFGNTAAMRSIRTKLERALQDDLPVLIEGESGTGKDVVGRFLHCHSQRHEGPFVKVNCGALAGRLLEGEMFGVGAYSANEAQSGSVGMAWGGTLFLDEIVDMDMVLQQRLTRKLQTRQDRRLDEELYPRFVCASSTDLELKALHNPSLTELLKCFCHRVRLLPLRERKRDIPQLCDYLAEKFARNFGRPVPHLSQSVLDAFCHWDWPGNIRELENWIARIVIFGTEEAMGLDHARQFRGRVGGAARRHRATHLNVSRARRARRRR
jgi:DNA-binding NtrC family response regulator